VTGQPGFKRDEMNNKPLNSSEIQLIYSGDGGGTTNDVRGPRIDKVRRYFGGLQGRKKILDVGCANGAILRQFNQQHELHGVDISEFLIKEARLNGFNARVHDLLNDRLPYEDGTFDYVFSGETIEHQLDTDWFLKEFNRVLKPHGRVVITYPNIRTPTGIAMMLFFDMPPMYSARYRSPHFRDFTLRSMKLALSKHGFRHEKSMGNSIFLPKIGEFAVGLASLLPSWSHQIITIAEKMENSKYTPEDIKGDNLVFGY
jgi:SAM-dependent methyltransferase